METQGNIRRWSALTESKTRGRAMEGARKPAFDGADGKGAGGQRAAAFRGRRGHGGHATPPAEPLRLSSHSLDVIQREVSTGARILPQHQILLQLTWDAITVRKIVKDKASGCVSR